ncbi:MAG TPA: hypothetical protein VFG42_26255 [Baekduia sp.]|uniref:hypothetical protein n=1 Tax=Baekduia sp. TaxID=2600305 RepID=UPI002D779AFB|nr:hypothetical protein [Baekduia sp.]HET6510324.1 hypothetical protein [Baekduia sp.]
MRPAARRRGGGDWLGSGDPLRGGALARAGDRLVAGLAAAAPAWIAIDLMLLVLGYPLPARFLIPASAAAAAPIGVGVTTLGARRAPR